MRAGGNLKISDFLPFPPKSFVSRQGPNRSSGYTGVRDTEGVEVKGTTFHPLEVQEVGKLKGLSLSYSWGTPRVTGSLPSITSGKTSLTPPLITPIYHKGMTSTTVYPPRVPDPTFPPDTPETL